MRSFKRILAFALALLAAFMLVSCAAQTGVDDLIIETQESVSSGTSAAKTTLSETETEKANAPPTETQAETPAETTTEASTEAPSEAAIDENGSYDQKDDVALYIRTYGHLPSNYITKKEAQALGWSGGSLERYAPGKCIGGDRFGNYEGLLPSASGRSYTECDIDTMGAKSRGAKRIVFSNDGLIYYTGDHYESFTLLYGVTSDEGRSA